MWEISLSALQIFLNILSLYGSKMVPLSADPVYASWYHANEINWSFLAIHSAWISPWSLKWFLRWAKTCKQLPILVTKAYSRLKCIWMAFVYPSKLILLFLRAKCVVNRVSKATPITVRIDSLKADEIGWKTNVFSVENRTTRVSPLIYLVVRTMLQKSAGLFPILFSST